MLPGRLFRLAKSIPTPVNRRFSTAVAQRLEKPPLRGQHRYILQNVLILAFTVSFATGYALNAFLWIPRKERMNKFFDTYDDEKRAEELLAGGILDLAIDDVD